MTYLGKNIRKIRSIQKMSQSEFAEIFGLSRASIGAYEEGRAEAKLDIIIKIANYFSITVDDLVNRDITVNQLYHFNIFDEKISGNANIGSELLKKISFSEISLLVPEDLLLKDIEQCRAQASNRISLPNLDENNLAVLISVGSFKHIPNQIGDNDVIIFPESFEIDRDTCFENRYWLAKSSKSLYIAEVKRTDKKNYLLFPDNSSPLAISALEIDFLLPIVSIVSGNPYFLQSESGKLNKMEQQINDLYNRI